MKKKNLLVFLGLDSLVSYLGGKAVEHKAGNFALSTLTLFKTIANTIFGSASNSSTIDRVITGADNLLKRWIVKDISVQMEMRNN